MWKIAFIGWLVMAEKWPSVKAIIKIYIKILENVFLFY